MIKNEEGKVEFCALKLRRESVKTLGLVNKWLILLMKEIISFFFPTDEPFHLLDKN